MRFLTTILTLGTIAYAAPASAAVQIFEFVAEVESPNSPYGSGTVFSGSFSYDGALVPNSIFHLDPAEGADFLADDAQYLSPGLTLRFALGGLSLAGGGVAGVFDMIDQGLEDGDRFYIANYGPRYFFDLSFEAGNATTFLDTRLPASFPANLWQGPLAGDDDDFNELDFAPRGEFSFYDAELQSGFTARVLSIAPTSGAVPEPSIWAMLIVGFSAIGGMLRRPRRSSGSLVAPA